MAPGPSRSAWREGGFPGNARERRLRVARRDDGRDLPRAAWLQVSFRIPFPSFLACQFAEAPGAEPWQLELWTNFPSNPLAPKFKSGGALFRGDARYEADSTNVIAGSRAVHDRGLFSCGTGRPSPLLKGFRWAGS